jgi:thioredoxin 1
MVAELLAPHPDVRHLKIEDGRGKPLGRSFAVKLWPTLVLLRDGFMVGRWVRPHTPAELVAALARVDV